MSKKIASNITILLVTLAFMTVFLFAVIKIYTLTLNETKKSHQQQQMEMAKAVTLGITTYLSHLEEDMHLLKGLPDLEKKDASLPEANINAFIGHYKQKMVQTIFYTDADGNFITSTGTLRPDWLRSFVSNQAHAFNRSDVTYEIGYSPVYSNMNNDIESGMSFCIIKPLGISKEGDTHISGIKGFVGYVIDFELLMDVFIEPLQLSKNDFAWVMDGRGRLIYHPKHRNMLLRSIKNLKKECTDCHASFAFHNRMIREPASVGEYKIGDEPMKVMAYVPIELQTEKWVLVISTFLPHITAGLRNNFRIFFIMGIIILTAILFFGVTLYYVNAKRIRAEEATRQAEKLQVLHEQLNQSSKLASVGELVDTVAHEINTPVGIISTQVDAISLQGNGVRRFEEEISIIKNQINRVSKYTRSLLEYSRRAAFTLKKTDIIELLEECLYLLGHRFRNNNIRISREYTYPVPKVSVDRGQMEQAFINILNNALDAIEKNGEIKIKIYVTDSDNRRENVASSDMFVIELIDTGKGIPEGDREKVFEAFYTSKKTRQGTGLGLYITKSIIQRHQGVISVSENNPQGCNFTINLPLIISGSV